jgi:hypothetical protein
MTKLYQNKEWLKKKYWDEKLSTGQIGEICKMSDTAIWHWLKKYNIPTRSRGNGVSLVDANHCDLSPKAISWINGELLGDGGIYNRSKYSARIQYNSKFLEYVQYVSDTLNSFGIKQAGKIRGSYDGKGSYRYSYVSLHYVELLSFRKKWYPEDKKIIPKGLVLNPLTIRQWFIGDGSLAHRKEGRPYITLATCGFTIPDVLFLVKKLIDLGFKATRRKSNNVIYITTKSTKNFLDYIGKCPVKCYEYKFNYKKEVMANV